VRSPESGLVRRAAFCFERGLGGGLKLVQFGLQSGLGVALHAVNKKDAVEVIVFVLDGARQQAAAGELDGFAFQAQGVKGSVNGIVIF
jgi:hypothetical protein